MPVIDVDAVKAVIEISQGNLDGIKYEIDPNLGTLKVDRLLTCHIPYPANYGFIPNTLAPDNDCTDILVVFPVGIQPTAVIDVKVIGALNMEDEHGMDVKIVAVPSPHVTDKYDDVKEVDDLPEELKDSIEHFFSTYKEKEASKGKWVNIYGWLTAEKSTGLIQNHKNKFYQKSFRTGER
jgi:inorganic pyrophosphatase